MIRPKRIAMFSSLRKLFKSEPDPREARRPLWNAVVAAARAPHWYAEGGVPDTLDGRFDMISLALALVLHRIDDDPEQGLAGVQLTELFVNDMDGQMRQIGFGDMRSEEHTSALQSLMPSSYSVFSLQKKKTYKNQKHTTT